MTLKPRDPLLAAARVILIVMMAIMALVGVLMAVLTPVLPLVKGRIIAQLAEHGVSPDAVWPIAGVFALVAVGAYLGFLFFRHLYRMVDTVGEGDPFIPANADRLSAMGWIAIAVHLLTIPLLGLLSLLSGMVKDGNIDADFGVDLSGILLVLILFILARVFRKGAEMREELEGTV